MNTNTTTTKPADGTQSAHPAIARLFPKISQSFVSECNSKLADSRSNKGCVFINYDADFGDFFLSPFFEREVTENQITVARLVSGRAIQIS